MKYFTLLLLSLALLATPAVFTGCGTTPQTTEARVFNSFRTTYNTARSAYEGYLVLVVQGKVSKADERRADESWNTFRASFELALSAASSNWNAQTPEHLQKLANDFILLISKL